MIFENVELSHPNITFGPDPGRIYSFDHENDSLVVKTYPGGTTVDIAPLDTNLKNEVKSVEYDGFYFWTLTKLGLNEDLGAVIEKWYYDGNIVTKQLGVGNDINLINGGGPIVYDSEAMSVQTYTTSFSGNAFSGSMSVALDSVSFLQSGDHVYLGPSSQIPGVREEVVVDTVIGNTVTFTTPLQYNYDSVDEVRYLKDIWLYNNSNGLDTSHGSLLRISTKTGGVTEQITGTEWRNVTAASIKSNGDFIFVRGPQLLTFRRFGVNAGFQTSAILTNIKPNRQDVIKVHDITVDSTSVLKLQQELVYFDSGSGEYLTTAWDDFNVDREFFANKVFSITHTRDYSVLFQDSDIADFTVKVRDQYDIPIAGRTINVVDDDPVGYIPAGYESFVTDSQGEGVSRYITGLGLAHATPQITVTDFATNMNSKTLFVQTPSVDNDGSLVQLEGQTYLSYIDQYTISGNMPVVQRELESLMPISQRAPQPYKIPLVQTLKDNLTYLDQRRKLFSDKPLVQLQAIEETVEVQQYDFLIFAIPEPFSIKNPVNTDILVRIVGFGALSLDPGTLIFKVNSIDVSSSVQVTAFPGGLELFYNPPVNFAYNSTVKVEIYILDTDVPPNLISTIYTFDTVADFKAPRVIERFPPNLSKGNSATTPVYNIVEDNETGIDVDSIEMFVNGLRVVPTITEPTQGKFKVLYQTPTQYAFESTVSASVSVSDLSGNKIVDSWNFEIGESSGILFVNPDPEDCQVLVPVDSSVCVEAFGKDQGIHIGSTEFEVDGKRVVFALVPKVYRKD